MQIQSPVLSNTKTSQLSSKARVKNQKDRAQCENEEDVVNV